MDTPSVYIPIDRRHALAQGEDLPDRTSGAVLFADISGFTPLTEALALELGPRRGAEELTVHLNNVYNALIDELHRQGGSVIGFSGDAITCWLDGDDGRRAITAAMAMQAAMGQFERIETHLGRVISLGMKVAVAVGPVRRFVVGDPTYVVRDVMAGQTLARMAAAEHLAERGDVIVDVIAAEALGEALHVAEWREDEESGERFAAVTALDLDVADRPWPDLADDAISDEDTEGWLLPPIYQRLQKGLGEFLAELRPAVALFLRFGGIDYDEDPDAPSKLDLFIREVAHILSRFDGSLIQLTVGDKGSYLYAAFGAPVAHEDDAVRAASAALDIINLPTRLPFLDDMQIGITSGRLRTGAYGSITRRTYGVLGDTVNLSARLMSAAKPGQILVSDIARESTGAMFTWERLPNVRVKGKREPVSLSRLVGLTGLAKGYRQELKYQLPMVGRQAELSLAEEKITQVLAGNGQVLVINAEAGMGKTRLLAEIVPLAEDRGLTILAGECQSYGTHTSYLVWQSTWSGFYGLTHSMSQSEMIAHLETELQRLDPSLLPRLPLLEAVLNISIPDNALTSSLDAKVRKASLEDLLLRCLRIQARVQPLVLVLEDSQWIDPLSSDLIEVLANGLSDLPVMMLIVQRPPDQQRLQMPDITHLPYYTEIQLNEFTLEEAEDLISLKLAQYFGDAAVETALVERVTEHADGNPFYIEELLNYLHDLGIDPSDTDALATLKLPESIHSLVLSRIDQLGDDERVTLRVASVIGRMFQAAMVWGVHPHEKEMHRIHQHLDNLSKLELTPLEMPEPEFVYLFKHVITQQVAYESLLYATRSMLHEQIGKHIEKIYVDTLDQYLDLLVHHYEHSENIEKKREYLLRAGDAAQKNYNLRSAITYLEKSLDLLEDRLLIDTRLKLGKVLELSGSWDEASDHYEMALSEAQTIDDQGAVAWCQTALGDLSRKQNQYETAESWLAQAQQAFEAMDDKVGIGEVLHHAGTLADTQGNKVVANQRYTESLAVRRELGDRENEASLLSNLGIVARSLGNRDAAHNYYEESLAIREQIDNRWGIAVSLNNLGNMVIDSGDFAKAQALLERSLEIWREIGEHWATTNTLHNLANVGREEGDFEAAYGLYADSIERWKELNDRWGISYWLEDVGLYHALQGAPERALQLLAAAATLRETIGAPRPPAYQQQIEERIASAVESLSEAEQQAATAAGSALNMEQAIELL